MSEYTDCPTVAYSVPGSIGPYQLVHVQPNAALAERVRAQQEQIEYLSAQSTRLISEAKSLQARLKWNANEYEDQQARDKRLVFHIERTEALRRKPSFFNPVKLGHV